MLNALYLITIILGVAGQNIVKKPYVQKLGNKGVYFFGMAVSLAALLFFVFTSDGLDFNLAVLPYSLGFAAAYCLAIALGVVAVKEGSLSLTSLITSYSLMMPTFYGLIFLNDPISFGLIPGLVLLVISLYFINKKDGESKFSPLWIVSVTVVFIGNGFCSIVQKMQQVAFDGAYKNEFMIFALGAVFLSMLVLFLVKERSYARLCVRSGAVLSLVCGLMNGIVNLFVMILSGLMPVSLMFPMISAGGIILVAAVSKFIYKERLTRLQWLGLAFGVGAVVFLNI